MTKHLRFLFVMLLAMVWTVGGAQTATNVVCTLAQKAAGCTSKGGTVTWTYANANSTDSGGRGVQWFKPSNTEIKATLGGVTNVVVSKIVVNANTNATDSKLSVAVGNTSYGQQTIDKGGAGGSTNKDYTFNGTANGTEVTLTLNSSKSLYIKTVTITYETENENLKESEISFSESTVTVNKSEDVVSLQTLVNPNNLAVTYSTSDNNIAEVEDGTIYLWGVGTVKIYADTKATDVYKAGHAEYTLNIVDDRKESGIAFDNDSYTADIANAESFYSAEHLANTNNLTLTYAIAPVTNVIDAETGEVLLTETGTYTITATFAGDESFKPATATCTLTVVNSNNSIVEFVAGTDKGTGESGKPGELSKDVVSVSSDNAGFGGSPYKLYGTSSTTISVTKGNIVKIKLEGKIYNNKTSLKNLNASVGTYSCASGNQTATWTGSAKNVTFKNTASAQVQVTKMTVYVEYPKSKDFTYSETSENTITAYDNANVTLERTLYNDGWNTFCVPFDVAKEQVAEVFGEGTQIMTLDEEASSGKTVKFVSAESISAHIPCLVWPATAGNSYTFNGVAVKSGEPEIVVGGDIMFTGIYSPADVTEGGSQNAAGLSANNKIVKMKTGGELKAFRAYFVLPDDVSASSYMVDINGTATAIDKIHVDGQLDATAPVYNLHGQRVNNSQLPSGIYVQNGRKFVVK